MGERIPITYGEFYDFPRRVRFRVGGEWFLLRSAFDEGEDDYPDFYEVFLLPSQPGDGTEPDPCCWTDLSGAVHLGRIGIEEVGLDETRRRSIDAEAFGRWLSSRKK